MKFAKKANAKPPTLAELDQILRRIDRSIARREHIIKDLKKSRRRLTALRVKIGKRGDA